MLTEKQKDDIREFVTDMVKNRAALDLDGYAPLCNGEITDEDLDYYLGQLIVVEE